VPPLQGTQPESPASQAQTERTRVAVVAVATFAVLFTIFVTSPVVTVSDSRWSIHTAMSLLRGQGGDLSAYRPVLQSADFYAIETCRDAPRTMFPIGVSVMAMPAVATLAAFSPQFESNLSHSIPIKFERLIASFYGALAAVVMLLAIHLRFGTLPLAVVIAVLFGLGTSMWSTGTRALWQHAPLMLMFAAAILIFERARRRPRLLQYAALPLAYGYVIRPTAAVPLAVLGLYVLWRDRPAFVRFALWAAVILVPWAAFNIVTCGTVLPAYYSPFRISQSATFAEALAGNLVSPARGLFIYSPFLIFAAAGFVIALRRLEDRALPLAFAAIVFLHWVAVSRFPHWWVGYSYGPRAMSDILPFLIWFVPFALPGLANLRRPAFVAATAVFVLLAAGSIAIHAKGALWYSGYM
jgi:hypothetical protein